MTTKTNSTLCLDAEVINLAHEMGLNVSKTCEIVLKQAINRLQGFNSETNSIQQRVNAQNLLVDRAGFEPAAFALRRWPPLKVIYSTRWSDCDK
jgi:post-segregation antitoxin (ccd killing protein)